MHQTMTKSGSHGLGFQLKVGESHDAVFMDVIGVHTWCFPEIDAMAHML